MAIISQNAIKPGFFVTSGRNSGEIDEKFDYFMQNKANFRRAQMNVNSLITKDYRKNDAFAVQKNKANSKPNKANLHFTAEKKNIYVSDCSIEKYALSYFSVFFAPMLSCESKNGGG